MEGLLSTGHNQSRYFLLVLMQGKVELNWYLITWVQYVWNSRRIRLKPIWFCKRKKYFLDFSPLTLNENFKRLAFICFAHISIKLGVHNLPQFVFSVTLMGFCIELHNIPCITQFEGAGTQTYILRRAVGPCSGIGCKPLEGFHVKFIRYPNLIFLAQLFSILTMSPFWHFLPFPYN